MNDSVEVDNTEASIQNPDRQMLEADDSVFELVTVAAQRCKQLMRGASPRIAGDTLKRKSTSIALEETRYGLVQFGTHEITTK